MVKLFYELKKRMPLGDHWRMAERMVQLQGMNRTLTTPQWKQMCHILDHHNYHKGKARFSLKSFMKALTEVRNAPDEPARDRIVWAMKEYFKKTPGTAWRQEVACDECLGVKLSENS